MSKKSKAQRLLEKEIIENTEGVKYEVGEVIEDKEGNAYIIEKRIGTISLRELKEPKKKNTELEKITESILDELGYENYEKQYRVYKYFVDFAFPDIRLAIEPGATYYHDEESDQKKEKNLNQKDWRVLWFDEDDLKKNRDEVKQEIKKKIEKLRKLKENDQLNESVN